MNGYSYLKGSHFFKRAREISRADYCPTTTPKSAVLRTYNQSMAPNSVRQAPGKRRFSNEAGRGKSFFLRCWPLPGTPVR
jgi:hypothetical protein